MVIKMLEKLGIDFIEISGGTYENAEMMKVCFIFVCIHVMYARIYMFACMHAVATLAQEHSQAGSFLHRIC